LNWIKYVYKCDPISRVSGGAGGYPDQLRERREATGVPIVQPMLPHEADLEGDLLDPPPETCHGRAAWPSWIKDHR